MPHTSVVKRVQSRTRRLPGVSPGTARLSLKKTKSSSFMKTQGRMSLAKRLKKARGIIIGGNLPR